MGFEEVVVGDALHRDVNVNYLCYRIHLNQSPHFSFFFQAEDGIRDFHVTGVQTGALPICGAGGAAGRRGPKTRTGTVTGAETVTRRRWMLVALGGASLVWALGGEWVSISHGVNESHLLDVTVGLSFFGAGIVALDRRPGNVIGLLMVAFAATWLLGNWGNLPI